MANYQYPVTAPERWDNVAFKAYGDASLIEGIVDANPDVAITAIIPAGTLLNIPVITIDVQDTATASLPPWLQ